MEAVSILDRKLRNASIPIVGVSENSSGVFTVEYSPQATVQQIAAGDAIVGAFDAEAELAAIEAAAQTERLDLAGLSADITNELTWITTAITDIDTGLGIVDSATLTQLRAIVKGVLQNQRRMLLEQRSELKAWRYVIRQAG